METIFYVIVGGVIIAMAVWAATNAKPRRPHDDGKR